jgi:dUTP pyrophosphatase
MQIKIKKAVPEAQIPKYAHGYLEDAGMDLVSIEDVSLQPGIPVAVRTGLSIEIPDGYEGQVRPRSGLSLNKAITVANAPGTIDPGYRGEIKVILLNLSAGGRQEIKKGDRIAQLVIAKYEAIEWQEAGDDSLSDSSRGASGFGSTGH